MSLIAELKREAEVDLYVVKASGTAILVKNLL
jgi:hypothetical protein